MLYPILAAVRIVLCLLVFLGILFRRLSVHRYMFFIVLLLPFWGVLIVLIQHFEIGFDAASSAEIGVERLKLESELYRSLVVDDKRSDMTVPMEEALLINSARERRSLIMDVLNDNPVDYVEFLQKAGNNEDTEVVHYAVTAMVEISKENDYMLQKLESAHQADPENMEVLSQYCDFLWSSLSQNLMQGQVEVMNRTLFSQLIQKKMEACGASVTDCARLAENELKCKHLDAAGDAIAKMGELWPASEEYVLLNLQYLASLGKGSAINDFIRTTENSNMYLSPKIKEAFAFWAN